MLIGTVHIISERASIIKRMYRLMLNELWVDKNCVNSNRRL